MLFLFSFISRYFLISLVISLWLTRCLRLYYFFPMYLWIFQFFFCSISFHCDWKVISILLFKYFLPSAGISVGLGWNHHHLPFPSHWILCPEIWQGNWIFFCYNYSSNREKNHFLCHLCITLLVFNLPCKTSPGGWHKAGYKIE